MIIPKQVKRTIPMSKEEDVETLGYKIHIATARVTRNGEPVELDLPTEDGSVVWLPYDDDVLSLIVQQVRFIRCAAA
jgi:hypothetical protein